MLIDAISSARFIGQEESNQLIKKIKGLASDKQAYRLSNQIHIDNRVVCEDKSLRLNIDKLHNAIQQRKAIKFRYGRYNLQKEFEERNPGKLYKVEPYGLVWNDGFYYLVGFSVKLEKIINYRVDRMRQLSVAEESFNKDYFNLAEHTNKCFNMYPGEVYHIKIKFDNHLINAIIDRFGRDVKIEIFNEEKFILSTKAALTEGLVRWILNWGSDAEVLYPNILVEKVKKEIEKMYEIYYRQ